MVTVSWIPDRAVRTRLFGC